MTKQVKSTPKPSPKPVPKPTPRPVPDSKGNDSPHNRGFVLEHNGTGPRVSTNKSKSNK